MDEDRWEEAFQENDRRTDRLLLLHETYRAARPAPSGDAPLATRREWERGLERFLARHMGWDNLADGFDSQPAERASAEDPSFGADEPDLDGFEGSAEDPLYETTQRLTAPVIEWHRALPREALEDADVQDFWIHALMVGAKVAGASAYTAPESLGGRIAALKRALDVASTAVEALRRLRDGPHLSATEHEVLAPLALAVQETRERFRGE